MNIQDNYTIGEAADKLGISSKTLRRWEESGRFTGSRTIGGQRRYTVEDIQILDAISNNIIPSDQELLTIDQAAQLAGVSAATVSRWTEEGKLNTFITSNSRYYLKNALLTALKQTNLKEGSVPSNPPIPQNNDIKPKLTPLPPQNSTSLTHHSSFNKHDFKLVIINIITTATLLGVYHFLSVTEPQAPTPTPIPDVKGITISEDPKLNIIKNLFDQSGNFSTSGTMRISGQLNTTRLTLTPTTKPLNPSAGQLYFDASSLTLELFNGESWQIISQGSAPDSTPSAQVTPTDTRLLLQ